jgi:hypothetical protein
LRFYLEDLSLLDKGGRENSIQGHTTAGGGYLQPFLREVHRQILRFASTTIIVACESI